MEQYAVEMLHITKRFPGIIANDDITLQLKKGEIHALWFIVGAGAAVWIFDECDIEPDKWIKKFDFSTGSLPVRSGWNFFDPQMFCFWVTVFIAGVLMMVYISSLLSRKEK